MDTDYSVGMARGKGARGELEVGEVRGRGLGTSVNSKNKANNESEQGNG